MSGEEEGCWCTQPGGSEEEDEEEEEKGEEEEEKEAARKRESRGRAEQAGEGCDRVRGSHRGGAQKGRDTRSSGLAQFSWFPPARWFDGRWVDFRGEKYTDEQKYKGGSCSLALVLSELFPRQICLQIGKKILLFVK